jgi:hypothetical protein
VEIDRERQVEGDLDLDRHHRAQLKPDHCEPR